MHSSGARTALFRQGRASSVRLNRRQSVENHYRNETSRPPSVRVTERRPPALSGIAISGQRTQFIKCSNNAGHPEIGHSVMSTSVCRPSSRKPITLPLLPLPHPRREVHDGVNDTSHTPKGRSIRHQFPRWPKCRNNEHLRFQRVYVSSGHMLRHAPATLTKVHTNRLRHAPDLRREGIRRRCTSVSPSKPALSRQSERHIDRPLLRFRHAITLSSQDVKL